jgi:hypothetical protein
MLLFVIGLYDANRITTFKRTIKYLRSDFDLMSSLVGRFDRIVTTPNIITEVDNLVRQLPAAEYVDVSEIMSRLCERLSERHVTSINATAHPLYPRVGITDTVTALLAAEPYLVVTDDFELANRLEKSGRDVININHIRSLE